LFCCHLAVSTSTTKMAWDNQIWLLFYARSQTTYQRQTAVALAPHIEILEFLFQGVVVVVNSKVVELELDIVSLHLPPKCLACRGLLWFTYVCT
jgi:hypothetical protein